MSFFATPLSGLNASSTALQTISNNLANMNTDGYKAQTALFSDVFYQNLGTNGNADPIQTGLGTQVAGVSSDLANGSVNATGVSSNMALDGSGYFVTSNTSGALSYTRAGDFTTNAAGQLTTQGGNLVMGYPAVAGAVSTSSSLQPLNVGAGITTPANATSTFSLTTNLNASTPVNGTYQSSVQVFDSLGGPHDLSVNFTKTGTNTWSYTATVPSGDLQGGTGTTTTVGSGTLNFDTTGALTSSSGSSATLNIGAFSDGAAAMNPTWTLTDKSGTSLVTQTASDSSNTASTQDGYQAGTLSKFAVLKDGTVQATFTNGQNRTVGQVAVASFANPEGLLLNGNDQYTPTSGSGAAVVGTAGTGGRGTIAGSSVEYSNVDVATEFSDLIVAQRSYEANAKAITAFDQVEQDTLAMKSS